MNYCILGIEFWTIPWWSWSKLGCLNHLTSPDSMSDFSRCLTNVLRWFAKDQQRTFCHFAAHRAGNLLIRSLLICSLLICSLLIAHFAQIKWATVSDLLISLKTNEQPWANRSGRSEEMSDCERITHVAQDKWATVSNSLRSLWGNKPMSDSQKKFWLKKSTI